MLKQTELIDDYDADFFETVDEQPQYIYMELKSTVSFEGGIDIDQMVEFTNMDDFMRALYSK